MELSKEDYLAGISKIRTLSARMCPKCRRNSCHAEYLPTWAGMDSAVRCAIWIRLKSGRLEELALPNQLWKLQRAKKIVSDQIQARAKPKVRWAMR